jgi:cytochrome c
MDSFEINKIAGAVLGTFTFVLLGGFAGELLFAEKKAAKAGYELAMPAEATAPVAAAAVATAPIAVRLATADVAKGETTFKQCVACHAAGKDGKNGTGPKMWGVVERAKGKADGYDYSNALKAVAAKGEKWDFAALDAFVENPKGYLAGTKMSYGGLANPKTRADLIAYLVSLSDSPVALPK